MPSNALCHEAGVYNGSEYIEPRFRFAKQSESKTSAEEASFESLMPASGSIRLLPPMGGYTFASGYEPEDMLSKPQDYDDGALRASSSQPDDNTQVEAVGELMTFSDHGGSPSIGSSVPASSTILQPSEPAFEGYLSSATKNGCITHAKEIIALKERHREHQASLRKQVQVLQKQNLDLQVERLNLHDQIQGAWKGAKLFGEDVSNILTGKNLCDRKVIEQLLRLCQQYDIDVTMDDQDKNGMIGPGGDKNTYGEPLSPKVQINVGIGKGSPRSPTDLRSNPFSCLRTTSPTSHFQELQMGGTPEGAQASQRKGVSRLVRR